MNISRETSRKCFVPSCKNTTTNSRNSKLFFMVKETKKREWCNQVNVEYVPGKRMFCCEDHFDLEEDLENYQYYKLMKGRPKLKANAKLRRIQDLPSCSNTETTGTAPTLKRLLLLPSIGILVSNTTEVIQEPTMPPISASTHDSKVRIIML